jgi:E3 ubiquitin-protein ligase MGRN1
MGQIRSRMGGGSSNQSNSQGRGLFGEGDSDPQFTADMLQALAVQGQQQYNRQPAQPAPMEQNRTTVRNHFALKKPSLQLVTKDGGNAHFVSFEFANTLPCSVNVYFSAVEDLDSGGRPSEYRAKAESTTVDFDETGHAQYYSDRTAGNISLSVQMLDRLVQEAVNVDCGTLNCVFPIVIALASRTNESGKHSSSQTTYANVLKKHDAYSVQILKQKIVVEGHDHAYDVQEIFGIANTNDEEDNECVVCMSEPRDTTVMPCRHMCLCHECAESLRKQTNKCPICRESVQSLLRINIEPDGKDT